MRQSLLRFFARTTHLLRKNSIVNHRLDGATRLFAGHQYKWNGFQLFRDLATYVNTRLVIITQKRPYNFYRSPSVLKKQALLLRKCKPVVAPEPCTLPQKSGDVIHRASYRKSTHLVGYWDENIPDQYNSVNIRAPLQRFSTSGKVLYTVETENPAKDVANNAPNIEVQTWNCLEPTQYGYWFGQPIKRVSANQVRKISQRQMNRMSFTKKYN